MKGNAILWQRVLGRDRTADGSFVYAVRTTGVYCRPSCGARRPRPENVSFHASPRAAAAAGFRPCRRCRPDQAPDARIATICRRLEQPEPPAVSRLAREAGWSASHFRARFRAATGLSPRAYAAAARDARLRGALRRPGTVTEAGYAAGFHAGSRLYAATNRALGMTPAQFQRGGGASLIRYATGRGPLGGVLVAESQRGVCAILLGDEPQALPEQLRREFPHAELREDRRGLAARLRCVLKGLDGNALAALPLDLQGTVFQRRVWQALRALPRGETISYAALARRLGQPRAARAVAQACAANRCALAVPCHRVVRGDGAPGGYRWGVERKQRLLAMERAPRA
ncbi:MAG TPA: bifunctional DNA-binding transcriptional regulator/O6-methylguanine-DNA methyltransferase Ada [Terriglobales bacterium]|jgi:AraC family transcriptional regulator of adaptative response/methylated-DNA-[protein]-cysteine methyltransferase